MASSSVVEKVAEISTLSSGDPTFDKGDKILINVTWNNLHLPKDDKVGILVVFLHSGTNDIAGFSAGGKTYIYGVWMYDFAPTPGSTSTPAIRSYALCMKGGDENKYDALVLLGDFKSISDWLHVWNGEVIGVEVKTTSEGKIDWPAYFGPDGIYDSKRFNNVMTVICKKAEVTGISITSG